MTEMGQEKTGRGEEEEEKEMRETQEPP